MCSNMVSLVPAEPKLALASLKEMLEFAESEVRTTSRDRGGAPCLLLREIPSGGVEPRVSACSIATGIFPESVCSSGGAASVTVSLKFSSPFSFASRFIWRRASAALVGFPVSSSLEAMLGILMLPFTSRYSLIGGAQRAFPMNFL